MFSGPGVAFSANPKRLPTERREPQRSSMITILFLGRNTANIIADAERALGETLTNIVIISRDNDRITPPDGLTVIPTSKFNLREGERYRVIGNGGTTAQWAPVVLKLSQSGCPLEIWDIQHDGATKFE